MIYIYIEREREREREMAIIIMRYILYVYACIHVSFYCVVCQAGTYSSPADRNCSACPDNSVSLVEGLAQCTCIEGYYRAATGEEDQPCSCKHYICS